MDSNKDIGTVFKQKLEGATKEPNAKLWDKIEVSLDKRDRKKRGFFFFWVGSGTATMILVLLYLNPSIFKKENKDQKIPITEIASENMEGASTSEFKTKKNNTFIVNDSVAGERISEFEQNQLNDLNLSEENSLTSQRSSPHPNKVNKEKDPFMDDSVTIKTTYHYYNGDTKQMLETTDKSVIDSLLERTNSNIDSLKVVETKILNPRKRDSLDQSN
ncbi:MAG: hypothetical protein AAF489_10075 [Bacteroidota bacterium]